MKGTLYITLHAVDKATKATIGFINSVDYVN